jgi:hypothetical protein
MSENNQHLDALSDIRSMMEKSSKFISLSGLSGVFAGLSALIGALFAFIYIQQNENALYYYDYAYLDNGRINYDFFKFFAIDAIIVFSLALASGFFFTYKKARKKNQPIWNKTSQRLLINLLIPLFAGGIFSLALLKNDLIGLIAPTTLIFYGLALINASKYTLDDIRYLGILEIIIGLISSFMIGYGLYFWALGFGVLHIIYGIIMYVKYEK